MEEIFADAGYWIAMLNPADRLHRKALSVTAEIAGLRIVTSEMVLVEFLNGVARLGNEVRLKAADTRQRLAANPNIDVVPQTSAQLAAAARRYAGRADQRWSVTDCASFLIMEERGIIKALAYDRDFVQAGFCALLRED